MSRSNPFVLAGIFLAFIGIFGGLPFVTDGLFVDSHEGDTYHLVDIALRMFEGRIPHLDFVTPLGILGFLPLVGALKAGLPFGAAFIVSQLMVALVMWPIIVYATWSRLTKRQAIAFGCITLGLILTMTYLHPASSVTVAMHYNRWAWAIAFVALLLAFCPPAHGAAARPKLDGALIGLLAMALLMIKITFFVSLAPAVIAALLVRKQSVAVAVALVTGVVLILVSTVFLGIAFWGAYYADLLNVARSEVRPNVGLPLSELLSGGQYISATLVGIAAALLIRRAGHDGLALVFIALLFPGFVYITYQNFGNDPTWLLFVAVLVLVFRPERGYADVAGIDIRGAMNVLSAAAILVNLPSFYASALAPLEHLAFDKNRFLPLLEGPEHSDFYIRRDRANSMTVSLALDENIGVWEKYNKDAERDIVRQIGGVRFPMCELGAGSRAYMIEIADRLEADGIPSGSQFFSTGLLSAFWLYGDFKPLQNGAPWYYGDLTGIENADYVLIPKCVAIHRVRGIIIDDLIEADTALTLLHDNELYALFSLK